MSFPPSLGTDPQEAHPSHRYPSNYGPEHGGDIAIAWEILDHIRPGVITDDIRAYLAGSIVGAMMRARAEKTK